MALSGCGTSAVRELDECHQQPKPLAEGLRVLDSLEFGVDSVDCRVLQPPLDVGAVIELTLPQGHDLSGTAQLLDMDGRVVDMQRLTARTVSVELTVARTDGRRYFIRLRAAVGQADYEIFVRLAPP